MSEVVIQRGDGLHLIIQRGVPGAPGKDGVSADWDTLPNKPAVIAAGDTAQEARDAIGLGTLVMADITDKQGKVLDDLTPLLALDIDSAEEPKGYLVSDLGGYIDGAQLFVQQTQEGLLVQTIHVPLLGKSGFRTKPVGGAWSDLAFTIAPFDIAGWHGTATAEAANAVINADGSFSRSLFVPAPLAPKITSGLTAEADTDILRPDPLTTAATFPNPIDAPMDGFGFVIELIDDGTARALTWGSDYAAGFAALPTTTTAGKLGQIAIQYRSGKYRCDGVRWMA